MIRKTLYTKNDPPLGFRLYCAPRDRLEQVTDRVATRFMQMMDDEGFTTHLGVVKEFMNADYVDGEGIFSFCRLPKRGDHVVLMGGPAHGTPMRYRESDIVETLNYPDGAVGAFTEQIIQPERHYYRNSGLNVATGRWEFAHER